MSLPETFMLSEEKAKELNLEHLEELSEKDFLYIKVFMNFGGVCNEEEIKQITDIVYKAYLKGEQK